MMYPSCPLPRHITALYMVAVLSSIALFSQSITIVGADILVYCEDPFQQVEVEFRDMPSRFGDSLPLQGFEVLIALSTHCKLVTYFTLMNESVTLSSL